MFTLEVKNGLPLVFLSILSLQGENLNLRLLCFYASRTFAGLLLKQKISLKLSAEHKKQYQVILFCFYCAVALYFFKTFLNPL